MADYYAILKRAINGLAEPTGESRRSVYEKARTALVAQLKSFDPPLSASEITQQRLQLEDAIRKVESESAKGLLTQALSRASLPDRTAPTGVPTSTPTNPPAPATRAFPEPVTLGLTPRPTAPIAKSAAPAPDTASLGKTTEPVTGSVPRAVMPSAEPTAPTRPPLVRPSATSATGSGSNTAPTLGMRVSKTQFEPITPPTSAPERPTAPISPTKTPPEPVAQPLPADTGGSFSASSNASADSAASYEQEEVTQSVANRVLKRAVSDSDRLGNATQETARRARDALSVAETPLDENLSSAGPSGKRGARKPLTSRDRPPREAPATGLQPARNPTARRGSRLPVIIGLVVVAVVALAGAGLYMNREVIAAYLGAQKPLIELAQRAPIEKPIVKSTDRLVPDEQMTKPTSPSNVKVVTTQPITPGNSAPSVAATSGQTDTAPAAGTAATVVTPAAPLPTIADVPPIAQKAALLEEAQDGTSAPILTGGTVIWQMVKAPNPVSGKPDITRLQGRVEIPDRGVAMTLTIEQNTDVTLQATHLLKLEFKLPADFNNKSVARVPGIIMKSAEQARGDPLSGATAKITSNIFWIALYAGDTDQARNIQLIRDRGWIDIPIVYDTNKRAMLTLEKAGAGDRVFNDALAAWGG